MVVTVHIVNRDTEELTEHYKTLPWKWSLAKNKLTSRSDDLL